MFPWRESPPHLPTAFVSENPLVLPFGQVAQQIESALGDIFKDQTDGAGCLPPQLVLALGKPANIYLIDEPSAYLDSEQRIVCARVGEEGRSEA